MKNSGECPRCQGRVFFQIPRVISPNYEYANSFEALSLTGYYGETGARGFLGSPQQDRKLVTMEAWVCRGCGFTDLYAANLALLEEMAKIGEGAVRIVDRSR